jgi:hypothetical protein
MAMSLIFIGTIHSCEIYDEQSYTSVAYTSIIRGWYHFTQTVMPPI